MRAHATAHTPLRCAAYATPLLALCALARPAAACGGEFVPPTVDEAVTTDHRMILSISQQQTTLWDEVQFAGSPSSFAWVLPIKGTATVGLSSDILFQTLDSFTAPQVQEPTENCPQTSECGASDEAEGSDTGSASGSGGGGVTVLEQAEVGPYETVQLASTNPGALASWLTAHGYVIPSAASSVIAAYVNDGFNFLALKLAPGEVVSTMRPVRVTTSGASPVLPLRMVAIGTGATTGITLWVIGDGRYEPQNFPFFALTNAEIVWDWNTNTSNYDTLRTTMEASLAGRGWQVESSLELAQSLLSGTVDQSCGYYGSSETSASFTTTSSDGASSTASGGASSGSATAGGCYLPLAGGDGDAEVPLEQDLTAVFAGVAPPNARITRMRSDIAHSALTADLNLQASADQSELSNIYVPASTSGTPPLCPVFTPCTDPFGASGIGTGSGTGSGNGDGVAVGGGGGCEASAGGDGRDASWLPWGAIAAFIGFGAARARRRRQA